MPFSTGKVQTLSALQDDLTYVVERVRFHRLNVRTAWRKRTCLRCE